MRYNKALGRLLSVLALCSFLSFNALAGEINSGAKKHEPITEQMITMVEHNAELRNMLIESIKKTGTINPDRVTNPVRTLEEYYTFIDWAAKALPWTILPRSEEHYV